MTKKRTVWTTFLAIGLAVAALDLWTKHIAFEALDVAIEQRRIIDVSASSRRDTELAAALARELHERKESSSIQAFPDPDPERDRIIIYGSLDDARTVATVLGGLDAGLGSPPAVVTQPVLRSTTTALDARGLPLRENIVVIPGCFEFEAALNYGAYRGLFGEHTEILAIVSLVALALIALFLHFSLAKGAPSAWFVVALGMLWGGTLGNFYDRYFIGGVRDFIKWFVVVDGKERVWPNFNIADSGICVGVGIIVVMEIARSLRGKTAGDPEDDEDTPAERESDGSAVSASTPRSGAS